MNAAYANSSEYGGKVEKWRALQSGDDFTQKFITYSEDLVIKFEERIQAMAGMVLESQDLHLPRKCVALKESRNAHCAVGA